MRWTIGLLFFTVVWFALAIVGVFGVLSAFGYIDVGHAAIAWFGTILSLVIVVGVAAANAG